jgi:NTP pyrophosphatase (non-canonical NTP hydrolase)
MDEFADVVLATLRLARFMDIDIALALKNKMEKIKNR